MSKQKKIDVKARLPQRPPAPSSLKFAAIKPAAKKRAARRAKPVQPVATALVKQPDDGPAPKSANQYPDKPMSLGSTPLTPHEIAQIRDILSSWKG